MLGILYFLLLVPGSWAQNTGISDKTITVGSLLPLEGDRKESGLAIKAGLEAAFASQSIQGRRIELAALNDFYDPAKA
ncbi:MAG TPA: branched-chain amino acid ABC transporter substrate-binding protein, partial [Candidatus Competibacteraceae bacterium]|nr:branched-chain amino acid ABC transporter substrate-binding protein [Candidatus Competibacteraceae bacterium]